MLSQNLATVQAFADKILLFAAMAKDVKVVAYFLNSGALISPANTLWQLIDVICSLPFRNICVKELLS